jgi:hypothetical protein
MPSSPTACAICESPLREEIEKHDTEWKDIYTVQWASKQGLNISRFSLLKHRTNHLQPVVFGSNGNGTNASSTEPDHVVTLAPIDLTTREVSGIKVLAPSRRKRERKAVKPDNDSSLHILEAAEPVKPSVESAEILPEKSEEKAAPEKPQPAVTDQLLLDTVRDRVYEKLISGEIKLDLGDGFKAIEIKHKIAEESQNEKLLLEILNEIRSQELEG